MATSVETHQDSSPGVAVLAGGAGQADLRSVPHPGTYRRAAGGLRIGIVAPPWVPVPPPAYGGTEPMIDALARGLTLLGHHVELFTVAESTCSVDTAWLFESCPDQIGQALPELRHAAAAYRHLTQRCDLIHDHTLAGVLLAAHRQLHIPVATTNHSPFVRHEVAQLSENVIGGIVM